MKKRSVYDINRKILWYIKETPGLHPNGLNKKVGTNPNSLNEHIKYLEDSEDIYSERRDNDPTNGQPSKKLYITEKGKRTLGNLEKRSKK